MLNIVVAAATFLVIVRASLVLRRHRRIVRYQVLTQHPLVASDWAYKAEGNLNVVFSYVGRGPHYVGYVLRARKYAAAVPQHDTSPSVAGSVSGDDTASAEARPRATLFPMSPVEYARQVIAPLLGEFVVPTTPCEVPVTFIQALQLQLDHCSARPDARRAGRLDTTERVVVLMPDTSTPPQCLLPEDTVVTTFGVELKPKWGCVPQPGFPSPSFVNDDPRSYMCRFCMFQVGRDCRVPLSVLPTGYAPWDGAHA